MRHYDGVWVAKYKHHEWLVSFIVRKNFLFDWDDGNREKSLVKHSIAAPQVESAFEDLNAIAMGIQVSPETTEPRFGMLGKDDVGRILFVCFTIRAGKVRPISARLANKVEKQIYE